ncbi:MAG: hypothetical protein ACP5OA_05800 [Candidatus Woesearchaeota archaeon]
MGSEHNINRFNDRNSIHKYIISTFAKKSDLVLIRGSTAFGTIKPFSDFDIEIYTGKSRNPFYEVVLYKDYPILLTVYYYKFEKGLEHIIPKNIHVLQGKYTNQIERIFQREINKKGQYNGKDLIYRKCQLNMDFFFKYMRSKDDKFLQHVNKKLRMD